MLDASAAKLSTKKSEDLVDLQDLKSKFFVMLTYKSKFWSIVASRVFNLGLQYKCISPTALSLSALLFACERLHGRAVRTEGTWGSLVEWGAGFLWDFFHMIVQLHHLYGNG